MSTTKRINRGHLLRAAKKGELYIRCRMSLTDDYAFDAANDFGRTDEFKQVKVVENHAQALCHACGHVIPMYVHDFRYKSGGIVAMTGGELVWLQLASTSWDFEIRKAGA